MAFRNVTENILIAGNNLRSYEAAEAILAGQVVKADAGSASRTVEPSDTDGESVVGVAIFSAGAGEMVTIARDGCIVRATSATGTIGSGDLVASHGGTGEEGELDTAGTGDHYLGVANEDDAGANGDVFVEINIGGVA